MDTMSLFTRAPSNPIIRPGDVPAPCMAVCNPGAHLEGDDVVLLLRVIDPDNHSHIWVARSRDGASDWRYNPAPLLGPSVSTAWYETEGAEDARVVWSPERGEYVVAYVGVSRFGAGVCLATTRDFSEVTPLGLVIHPYNKDAALFPRQIGGRYYLLHRPTAGPLENIWVADSDNLTEWGNPRCVLEESDQPGWYSGKVGAGPPPIETEHGWLLIFHGVQLEETGWLYRVGLALLDREDPSRILAKTPQWVFGPEAAYEMQPPKPGIVFPCGAVIREGVLSLYYGAADSTVCLATAPLQSLLDALA